MQRLKDHLALAESSPDSAALQALASAATQQPPPEAAGTGAASPEARALAESGNRRGAISEFKGAGKRIAQASFSESGGTAASTAASGDSSDARRKNSGTLQELDLSQYQFSLGPATDGRGGGAGDDVDERELMWTECEKRMAAPDAMSGGGMKVAVRVR